MQVQKSVANGDAVTSLPKPLHELTEVEIARKYMIGKVTTKTLLHLTKKFSDEGFEWLLPVVFAKSTDPLWPDPGASIEKRVEVEIYGETVRTTLSMIVHKMVASSLGYPKLFTLSPNVRIERRERQITGRHLYEFTQLDFEISGGSFKEVKDLVEKAIAGLIADLKANDKEELTALGVYDALHVPHLPFQVYDREDLEMKYGKDWEPALANDITEPAWIVNIPREFYDFEDFKTGRWDNYDLFAPKFGEVLSGAKREWDYEKMLTKITRDGIRKENFELLLNLAKEGRIKPSAGAGIGVERLVRWIVGAKHIGEVQPFPKTPGMVFDL